MMGTDEGLSQKFAYYTEGEKISQERWNRPFTSARNLPRCRMTVTPSAALVNDGRDEVQVLIVRLTRGHVESIKELGDESIHYLAWRDHAQNLLPWKTGRTVEERDSSGRRFIPGAGIKWSRFEACVWVRVLLGQFILEALDLETSLLGYSILVVKITYVF